ncbi:hypothetical protein [Streptomyces sp. NBC_00154]|uniref:hypothetical protein n=1 Tax=Streptomyces sp. NBC_00154 TaxID=2975670 RepID=UPI002B1DD308|nr:hypothetical protein [Streptomyces sp. NBC_00154]
MFAACAEFIRELIVQGTHESLAAARARGKRIGRPAARHGGATGAARSRSADGPGEHDHVDCPDEVGVKTGCAAPESRSGSQCEGCSERLRCLTRGVVARQQYIAREGKHVVGRGHVEELPDGTTVRSGVFLSNQKSRRDRLTDDQLAQLAALGLEWASV